MKERSFDEMIACFNRRVSEMDIAQDYKMELLGMVTALGYKHEKTAQQRIPCSERLPEYGTAVLCNYTEDDIGNAFNEGFELGQESQKNVTLYGYDMNELVEFAIACRACGITDADLKQFVTNIDFAFESIQNSLKEVMRCDKQR